MAFVIAGAVALCFVGGLLLPPDWYLYSTNLVYIASLVLITRALGVEHGSPRFRHVVVWAPIAVVWFVILFTAEWFGRGYGETWGPA